MDLTHFVELSLKSNSPTLFIPVLSRVYKSVWVSLGCLYCLKCQTEHICTHTFYNVKTRFKTCSHSVIYLIITIILSIINNTLSFCFIPSTYECMYMHMYKYMELFHQLLGMTAVSFFLTTENWERHFRRWEIKHPLSSFCHPQEKHYRLRVSLHANSAHLCNNFS